jgi:hypothetical protein
VLRLSTKRFYFITCCGDVTPRNFLVTDVSEEHDEGSVFLQTVLIL